MELRKRKIFFIPIENRILSFFDNISFLLSINIGEHTIWSHMVHFLPILIIKESPPQNIFTLVTFFFKCKGQGWKGTKLQHLCFSTKVFVSLVWTTFDTVNQLEYKILYFRNLGSRTKKCSIGHCWDGGGSIHTVRLTEKLPSSKLSQACLDYI